MGTRGGPRVGVNNTAAVAAIAWLHAARDRYDSGFTRHVFGQAGALTTDTVRFDGDWLEVTLTPNSTLSCPRQRRQGCGEMTAPHAASFDLGGSVALFDEISSYAIMLADKTHRPGTTITLSAHRVPAPLPLPCDTSRSCSTTSNEAHASVAGGSTPSGRPRARKGRTGRDPTAGANAVGENREGKSTANSHGGHSDNRVVVRARVAKCGRTVGFATCELRTVDDVLLMVGEHIKYLPMPMFWNWTVGLCQDLTSLDWVLRLADTLHLVQPNTTVGVVEKSTTVYTLDDVTIDSAVTTKGSTTQIATATLRCSADHMNPMGIPHGGMVAMVLGEVGWLAACGGSRSCGAASSATAPRMARSMDVRYLSPTPRRFVVRAVATRTQQTTRVQVSVRPTEGQSSRVTTEATIFY